MSIQQEIYFSRAASLPAIIGEAGPSHASQEKLISRVAIIAQLPNYNRCGRDDTKHISRKGKNPRNSPANSRKSPHPFPRGDRARQVAALVRYVPSVRHPHPASPLTLSLGRRSHPEEPSHLNE